MDPRKKSRHQQAVEAMMNKIGPGHEVPEEPTMPDEKIRVLRARLILEEALEFCEAAGVNIELTDPYGAPDRAVFFDRLAFFAGTRSPDMVEMADGLADISVVTIGSMSAMGIADCSLLEEVDNNNLAKFEERGPCEACGGVGWIHSHPAYGSGSTCPSCKGRKTLGGYRDEHGKWIKPVDHKPPNIAAVLASQEEGVHHE